MSVNEAPAAPQISVIIPAYGEVDSVRHTLAALARQDLDPECFEVIVCDNNPRPVYAAALNLGPGQQVVHESTPGSYAARNAGVAAARGDLLAFTDADCRPAKSWLRALLTGFGQQASVDILGGPVVLTDIATTKPATLYEAAFAFDQNHSIGTLHYSVTANMAARRRVFAAVGGFDSTLKSGGDLEWGRRAWRAGFVIDYCPAARVFHPARQTVAQLASKRRRIQGGLNQMSRRWRTPWQHLVWIVLPEFQLRSCLRLIARPALKGLSRSGALQVSAIALWLAIVTWLERVRLQVGGDAIR